MHLKEKLAQEYAFERFNPDDGLEGTTWCHAGAIVGFIAGFEKAIQMSLELSKNMADHSYELHGELKILGEKDVSEKNENSDI